MPTPLAHGVAGIAALRTARGRSAPPFKLAFVAIIIAQVPDIDFLPGLFTHNAGMFHRGATHSIAGAVLISLLIAAVVQRISPWLLAQKGESRPRALGPWLCCAFVLPVYLSHIALDLVSLDVVDNSGLTLWWPVSHTYVALPLPLPAFLTSFFDLEFGPARGQFFATLFSLRAVGVYVVEALLFSPLLLVPWLLGRRRRRGQPGARGEQPRRAILDLEQGAEA